MLRKKRALVDRIKVTEAKYVEKKISLEFENLRIQLAAEVAKSKARVKILEAPNEVRCCATLKSETSYLDQPAKKRRSEREVSERVRTSFHSQEKRKM